MPPDTLVSSLDIAVVVGYLALMIGIGIFVYRKAPSFEEFVVAGRSMTTPILVCTLASTYYGLEDLFGTSEFAYNDGIVAYFGYTLLSLGIYVFAAFALAKRLRNEKFISLPEILERYYGRDAGILGAVASFAYSIPALSLFALGRICEVTLGVDAWKGALVLGLVALVYTLLGGLWAVAITDTIQFVLMMVTVAIGIVLLMGDVGGFAAVQDIAAEGYFAPLGGMPIWLLIAYVASLISVLVDPGFYQRIFAARSARQARNAIFIAIGVWLAYDWLVTAGGMLARAAVHQGMLPAGLHSNDALLSGVIMALPTGLVGVFLAGVLATAMSTMDSYSLVAGTNLAYDVHRPLWKSRRYRRRVDAKYEGRNRHLVDRRFCARLRLRPPHGAVGLHGHRPDLDGAGADHGGPLLEGKKDATRRHSQLPGRAGGDNRLLPGHRLVGSRERDLWHLYLVLLARRRQI